MSVIKSTKESLNFFDSKARLEKKQHKLNPTTFSECSRLSERKDLRVGRSKESENAFDDSRAFFFFLNHHKDINIVKIVSEYRVRVYLIKLANS